jgi:hypothetical protein
MTAFSHLADGSCSVARICTSLQRLKRRFCLLRCTEDDGQQALVATAGTIAQAMHPVAKPMQVHAMPLTSRREMQCDLNFKAGESPNNSCRMKLVCNSSNHGQG